jgi:hypothetical protein
VGRHRDAIPNDGGEYPVIVSFTRCHSTFDAEPNSFAFAEEGELDEAK